MSTQIAQVRSRPPNLLDAAEQRAFYAEQGDLVSPQWLSPVELADLRTALADVLRDADGLTATNDKFSVTQTDDGQWSVRRIFNPIAHHPVFHDLVSHPKILDVVENLIGPNIQLHHTKLNLKP